MQSILPDKSLELESVDMQNARGEFIPLPSARFVQHVVPPRRLDDTAQFDGKTRDIPIPLRDIISDRDLQERRKAIQEVLLHKHKPRLVRSVNGGRNNGLGIRDLTDTEFRKEWLQFKEEMYLNVNVTVTDNDGVPITDVTVHGKIISRNDTSPVLNNLGVLYEVDPDSITGTPYDTETYAPMYLGRRKLRYWVGVYYDLKDNKVIITADTIKYAEIVESLSPGGKGDVRLAEYLVTDIKLSNQQTTEVPYPGDYEDKQYKDLLATANRIGSETLEVPEDGIEATKTDVTPPKETSTESSVFEPQTRLAEPVNNESADATENTMSQTQSAPAVVETETVDSETEQPDEETLSGAYKGALKRLRKKKKKNAARKVD